MSNYGQGGMPGMMSMATYEETLVHFHKSFGVMQEIFDHRDFVDLGSELQQCAADGTPPGMLPAPSFLDLGCAPGGFSACLLQDTILGPNSVGYGVSLPPQMGGFQMIFGSDRLCVQLNDILQLESHDLMCADESVDLCLADAQYLSCLFKNKGMPSRQTQYRGTKTRTKSLGIWALTIKECALAFQKLRHGGSFIFRFGWRGIGGGKDDEHPTGEKVHPDLMAKYLQEEEWYKALTHWLFSVLKSLFTTLKPFKSEYVHQADVSFYMVCRGFDRSKYNKAQWEAKLQRAYEEIFDCDDEAALIAEMKGQISVKIREEIDALLELVGRMRMVGIASRKVTNPSQFHRKFEDDSSSQRWQNSDKQHEKQAEKQTEKQVSSDAAAAVDATGKPSQAPQSDASTMADESASSSSIPRSLDTSDGTAPDRKTVSNGVAATGEKDESSEPPNAGGQKGSGSKGDIGDRRPSGTNKMHGRGVDGQRSVESGSTEGRTRRTGDNNRGRNVRKPPWAAQWQQGSMPYQSGGFDPGLVGPVGQWAAAPYYVIDEQAVAGEPIHQLAAEEAYHQQMQYQQYQSQLNEQQVQLPLDELIEPQHIEESHGHSMQQAAYAAAAEHEAHVQNYNNQLQWHQAQGLEDARMQQSFQQVQMGQEPDAVGMMGLVESEEAAMWSGEMASTQAGAGSYGWMPPDSLAGHENMLRISLGDAVELGRNYDQSMDPWMRQMANGWANAGQTVPVFDPATPAVGSSSPPGIHIPPVAAATPNKVEVAASTAPSTSTTATWPPTVPRQANITAEAASARTAPSALAATLTGPSTRQASTASSPVAAASTATTATTAATATTVTTTAPQTAKRRSSATGGARREEREQEPPEPTGADYDSYGSSEEEHSGSRRSGYRHKRRAGRLVRERRQGRKRRNGVLVAQSLFSGIAGDPNESFLDRLKAILSALSVLIPMSDFTVHFTRFGLFCAMAWSTNRIVFTVVRLYRGEPLSAQNVTATDVPM